MKKLSLLLLLLSTVACAQKNLSEAALPGVPTDGFYNLKLDPQWIPYLNGNISNVRIVDRNNQDVPYLLQKEVRVSYAQQFKKYEIVEKKLEKNCCTSILLRNPDDEPINNISLSIKNAEVIKQATLLGSDDNQSWYALKQHFVLSSINSTKTTSGLKIVDFPLSNYTYYLLQIEDSTSAPINVLSAGYYEVNTADGSYTPLKLEFHQVDSIAIKRTYLFIDFNKNQIIDKLYLHLEGQPYFLRRASLFQKTNRLNKKGYTIYYFDKLWDFTVSSKQKTVLELDNIRTNEFQIIIENDDNPPLRIKQVEAYLLNRYFTVWLKARDEYKVRIGDKSMVAPVYDLEHFKESITSNVPTLAAGALVVATKAIPEISVTYFTSRNVIWVAIILVIAVFGFMAVRMARETSKRGD